MPLQFWRGYRVGIADRIYSYPLVAPAVTYWNGARVTEIEWAMYAAFNHFDSIVREAHRRLDEIIR